QELTLTNRDQLWLHILRADVGQGRGDHRQMLGAASSATALGDLVDDPAGVCLARHYGALVHLTDEAHAKGSLAGAPALPHRGGARPRHYGALVHLTDEDHAKGSLAGALDLAHRSGDPRLVTLIEAFL